MSNYNIQMYFHILFVQSTNINYLLQTVGKPEGEGVGRGGRGGYSVYTVTNIPRLVNIQQQIS